MDSSDHSETGKENFEQNFLTNLGEISPVVVIPSVFGAALLAQVAAVEISEIQTTAFEIGYTSGEYNGLKSGYYSGLEQGRFQGFSSGYASGTQNAESFARELHAKSEKHRELVNLQQAAKKAEKDIETLLNAYAKTIQVQIETNSGSDFVREATQGEITFQLGRGLSVYEAYISYFKKNDVDPNLIKEMEGKLELFKTETELLDIQKEGAGKETEKAKEM